jgi:tRNA-2-methylthio-N6-dimethylallyladenosine synthase
MNREYTREQYLDKIDCVRRAKRAISITSDIIVGFPGETEADFEQTLSLLEYAQYDALFSFKYSPRPGTAALALADAVAEEEKGRRLAILQAQQRALQERRNQALIGQQFELLVEGQGREGQLAGRTSCHRVVNFRDHGAVKAGDYVWVRVTQAGPNSLVGELEVGLPSEAISARN